MQVIRRRLLGIAFLAIIVLLLALSVALYQKAFADTARVTLKTDSIGNQLQKASDVKIRGLIVGEVRSISASASGATLDLAIDRNRLSEIPADVTARLLPKTLFGERYVALEIPDGSSAAAGHLAAGATIGQDRSSSAIELEKVVDDLLPLLQAVQPQDLATTLGAISDALRGRGDALGANLADLGSYVGSLNTELPTIKQDISEIADASDVYDSAANDLLGVLGNLSVTSSTVVDVQQQLLNTFTTVRSASDTTATFLADNEQQIINLAQSSLPNLTLFAEYSPEYTCMLHGLTKFEPLISKAFSGNALNLDLTISLPARNGYAPGDQVQYADKSAPTCAGLGNIDGIVAAAANGSYYCPITPDDGVSSPDSASYSVTPCTSGKSSGAGGKNASASSSGSVLPLGLTDGGGGGALAGSSAETAFVKSIVGATTGQQADQVSDLVAAQLAPVLRGTQVDLG